jgi:flavin-dependent dehydrogenase
MDRLEEFDAIVVGGGPSGATAAAELLRPLLKDLLAAP